MCGSEFAQEEGVHEVYLGALDVGAIQPLSSPNGFFGSRSMPLPSKNEPPSSFLRQIEGTTNLCLRKGS